MKIALISPAYDSNRYRIGENLGLKYLKSCISKFGHEVDIYELVLDNISDSILIKMLQEKQYNVIGITILFTQSLKKVIGFAEKIKGLLSNVHIVFGGQGISFVWPEILQTCMAVDSCVVFEGEVTFLKLISELEKGNNDFSFVKGIYFKSDTKIKFSGFRDPIENLDSLPFPLREKHSKVLGQDHYTMLSSRGCSCHCTFCVSGNYGNKYHNKKRWRFRSPENIISEIDHLVSSYNAKAISFIDDLFLGGSPHGAKRADKFVNLIKTKRYSIKWAIECRADEISQPLFKRMKEAGLEHVFVGIDGGKNEDLKLYAKGIDLKSAENSIQILRKLDVSFEIGFIMFNPISTYRRIKRNLSFLKKNYLGSYKVLTNQIELYNGSALIEYFSNIGLAYKDGYQYKYRYKDKSLERLRKILCNCLRPLSGVEIELKKSRFQLQTGIESGSRSDLKRSLEMLSLLEKELSIKQIEIAEKVTDEMENLKTHTNINHKYNMFLKKYEAEAQKIAQLIKKKNS